MEHPPDKRINFLTDWRVILSSLEILLKKKEMLWSRARDEGHKIFRWVMWKHHFSSVDTSNAIIWLTVPAHHVPPRKPVINNLPIELLTNIFSLVVRSDCSEPLDCYSRQFTSKISFGSSPTTPIALTHVCHFWRTVVHRTPVLWSTILVDLPRNTDVEYVSFVLHMSRNCPLTLGLRQFVDPDLAAANIAGLFVRQAYRWRRISFDVWNSTTYAFLKLNVQGVPMLEEYQIFIEFAHHIVTAYIFNVLNSSPALKKTDWEESHQSRRPQGYPWLGMQAQLSEIILHDLQYSDFLLDALSQSQSLKTLGLFRMRNSKEVNRFPILLPRLERLICDRPHPLALDFEYFTLPALQDLEITFRALGSTWVKLAKIPLINMLHRSRCQVKTLTVEGCFSFLISEAVFQSIDTFKVLSNIGTEDLIRLRKNDDEFDLLPNMQNFLISGCAQDEILPIVVLSRRHQLRTLQVYMDIDQSPNLREALRWLRDDGVLVSYHKPISRYSHSRMGQDVEGFPFMLLPQ